MEMKSKRQSNPPISTKFSAAQLRLEAVKNEASPTAFRFLALADVIDGESCANTSKRYGVSTSTVYYWIRCLSDRGIRGFDQRSQKGRKCHLDNRYGISRETLVSAAEGLDHLSSRRIMAISRLLEKVPCIEVARDAGITPSTLSGWIKRFNDGGIAGLLSTNRQRPRAVMVMRNDISVAKVHGAARIASRRTSRRLMAVADVLEGKRFAEVAGSLNVSISAVGKWCRRFNERGIEGLVDLWEVRSGRASKTLISR